MSPMYVRVKDREVIQQPSALALRYQTARAITTAKRPTIMKISPIALALTALAAAPMGGAFAPSAMNTKVVVSTI